MAIIPHLHSRPGSVHEGEMKSTFMFITGYNRSISASEAWLDADTMRQWGTLFVMPTMTL
jgi:hypothetical protein